MIKTAIWIPPTLCGCEIQLTGNFVKDDDVVNGISYRHPEPGTITNVTIVKQCAAHANLPDTFNPADPYDGGKMRGYLGSNQTITVGSPNYNSALDTQLQDAISKGYKIGDDTLLDVWFVNSNRIAYEGYVNRSPSTPDEILYTYLSRFGGCIHRPDTCGCQMYFHHELGDNQQYVDHPIHSKSCWKHHNDVNHQNALAMNQEKNGTLVKTETASP